MKLLKFIQNRINSFRDALNCDHFSATYQTIVIPHIGVMNANGRIYDKGVLKKMCGTFKDMFGQIGHPDDLAISLFNASHKVHRAFISEDALWAEYSILNNPSGRLLIDLLQESEEHDFVLAPRGVGTINEKGEIQSDYKLLSFDFIPKKNSAFYKND